MAFKRLWLLVATVICTSAVFISCSDDEPGNDEGQDGGNAGIGNGGTGVEVLPKKVTRIVEKTFYTYYYDFFYDEENRLVNISGRDGRSDEYSDKINIVYEKDSINVKRISRDELQDEYGIKLKNGKATKNSTVDNLYYDYSDNGYLKAIRCPSERYTEQFTINDGVLTSIYIPQDDETKTITPDMEIENNTNVDLYGFEYIYPSTGNDYAILLCATGKRIKYLPKKWEDPSSVLEYSYEINSEGYITKITRNLKYKNPESKFSTVFEIIYEE